MSNKPIVLAAATLFSLSGTAMAQNVATTTTDLNLRAGPSGNYEVLATMPTGADVAIAGCIETGRWCQVSYDGVDGFASARYLQVQDAGAAIVVAERPSLFQTVVAEPVGAVASAGSAVVGALTGAVSGAVNAITPEPQVATYIETNPAEPIYLDGEVVVGAAVPTEVALREVPDTQYRYASINGQPVLIDPGTRQIVYVYR